MKKAAFGVFVIVLSIACIAIAAPKLVPDGTIISANLVEPGIAEVTITDPIQLTDVEFYSYEKIVKLGSAKVFRIKLHEGRRFNFKFKDTGGKEFYALITPEMSNGADFLGPGVGVDCSDPRGCCFIVTGDKKN